MAFRHKYGVCGAGAVAKSLIGRIPSKTRDFGPVSAISYRVASRIANTLRAGYPVRSAEELESAAAVLFHAPPDQAKTLLEFLQSAEIRWVGKALIFCDCDYYDVDRRFDAAGAGTAMLRDFGIPGHILLAGNGAALSAARRIARGLRLKPVEILPGAGEIFDAAVTLGTTAVTPLIDSAASLLRQAGLRDPEAARVAAFLFAQTARGYAHSGKQSWAWYTRGPENARIARQLAMLDPHAERMLRQLLQFGLDLFGKCPGVSLSQ